MEPDIEVHPQGDDPLDSERDREREREREREAKRQRTSLACEACRRRKSRCDIIVGTRCHRCHQLGTVCSLEARPREGDREHTLARSRDQRAPQSQSHRQSLGSASGYAYPASPPPPTVDRALRENGGVDEEQRAERAGQSASERGHRPDPPISAAQDPPADVRDHAEHESLERADSAEILALRRRVLELERRETGSMSGGPQHDGANGPSVQVQAYSPQTPSTVRDLPPDKDKVRDETWYRRAADPEAFSLIHGGMGSMAEHGLRDPVTDGILSASLAEALYQIFKHNIAGILPYPTLLNTRSKLPKHPYLRSACLLFGARCFHDAPMLSPTQIRQLEVNLSQNLLAYHRGCRPSLESVFAGLIISFLPHGQGDGAGPSDFDPARMVGMSYGQLRELGHSVFIERVVDTLRGGARVEDMQQMLDDARLHFCIMTRVSWTNLSRCPSNDLPTSLNHTHHAFTQLLKERGAMVHIDRHLMFEHEALDILMTQAHAWHRLERVAAPTAADVAGANETTALAVRQMNELRARAASCTDLISLPWVLCQISYLRWWTTIRNIWFTYRLPTPLVVPDLQSAWVRGLSLGAQASADMITECLTEGWDLCVFPKAIATSLVLCYHTLSMASAHLGVYTPHLPLPPTLDEARLEALARYVSPLCPTMQDMLRRATTTLDEYKRQIHVQSRRPSGAGLGTAAGGGPAQVMGWETGLPGAEGNGAAPFSFNFVFDDAGMGMGGAPGMGHSQIMGGLGGSMSSMNGMGLGQAGGVSHWDPFVELGNGWSWYQTLGQGAGQGADGGAAGLGNGSW